MKRNKLRKQPKKRRTYSSSAVNFASLNVPDTARKRRRRQKTKRVRFGLVVLKRFVFSSRWVSLGLLALTIFALVIIVQERRFYLTYIPVDGAVTLPPEEIVAASNLAGSHIFAADPSKAAAEIATLPGVISSTVSLKWPNQVYIEIAEEAPVAIWQENGLDFGVTSGGRLIPVGFPIAGLLQIIPETNSITAVAPIGTEEDLNAVEETELVEETPAVEEDVTLDEGVKEGVETLADNANDGEAADSESVDTELEPSIAFVPQEVLQGALNLRKLKPSINELYYRPSEGLSYEDGRGWRVHFGTGTDMNQKLVLYETILADLLSRDISPVYISVSNKNKPYYLAQ
jgi:hypothetical protein